MSKVTDMVEENRRKRIFEAAINRGYNRYALVDLDDDQLEDLVKTHDRYEKDYPTPSIYPMSVKNHD